MPPAKPWQKRLSYLIGSWSDVSRKGVPGTATASGELWESDLNGHLLTRRAWCHFPSTPGRPAFRHEDILVVYEGHDEKVHALFWDNEGHYINYRDVYLEPGDGGVRFLSDPKVPGPRQHLKYSFQRPNRFAAVFSLRLPGATAFLPYLEWKSLRVRSPFR